jgi:hypothetical protein
MSATAPLDVLRTVVQETADAGSDLAQSLGTAELEEFLSGPPVVWVVGPPHGQRSSLAEALAVATPAALVTEHDPAALPRYPLWDVAVVVTPADQVLSAHEVRFVVEAAKRRQAVLLVVSRLYVLGDEKARTAGRAEIERYRLSELLGPRRVPWFFDDANGPDDTGGGTTTAVTAAVSEVLADRQDHASAGGAAVQALLDGVVDALAARLPDREADRKRVDAVGAQHAAHSAYLRGLATEYVARGVERLRGGNDRIAHALATVVDAADSWVTAGGEAPWPDAEGPVRLAWAEIVRVAHALPTGLRAELRAEIGRVEEGVRRDLVPLVPEANPAPWPAPRWQLEELEAVLGRLDDVDLGPVLQRAEARTRAALAAEQEQKRETASTRRGPATASAPATSGSGSAPAIGGEVGRGRHAARALRYGAARAAGTALRKLNSTPLAEDLRAALLADVTLAVGDRLDEVVAAVRREIAPAARAECEAGVERLHTLVATAQDAVQARHRWYGAYRRLLDLRDGRRPVDVP